MAIPIRYRKGQVQPQAIYNFTDVAEGKGIALLYGSITDASGARNLILTSRTLDPGVRPLMATLEPRRIDISGNGEQIYTLNAFNAPRVVEGDIYLNFTWVIKSNDANAKTARVVVKLYKNSTQIGTDSTGYESYSINESRNWTSSLVINIDRTFFKRGDQLKVGFEAEITGNITVFLHHDPNNNDFTANTPNVTASANHTDLQVYVPFKI